MSDAISAWKRCLVRLCLQLFLGALIYVICVCLRVVVSGDFGLFFFLLCTLCCQLDCPFLIAPSILSNVHLCFLNVFAYSGVRHILCCVLVLFFFFLSTICCQFLWLSLSSSCVPYVASFSGCLFFVLCTLFCQFLWLSLSSSCVSYVASFSGFCLSSFYVPYDASFSGCLCLRLVYPMLLVSLDFLCLRLMYHMLLVSLVVFVFVLCTLC